MEIVFLTYKLMIILLISPCGTPSQQSSTILPSNKVHHKASPRVYGALKQPPLNRDLTPSLESSNKVHHLFDTLITFDYTLGSQLLCSTFEEFIDMAKLRVWLWYRVRNHEPPQLYDIVYFEQKLSWLLFFSPKVLVPMEIVFLTYKLMIILLISQVGLLPNNPQQSPHQHR